MRALILFRVRGAEEIVAALIGIGREADRGEGFDLVPSTRSRRNSSSIDRYRKGGRQTDLGSYSWHWCC